MEKLNVCEYMITARGCSLYHADNTQLAVWLPCNSKKFPRTAKINQIGCAGIMPRLGGHLQIRCAKARAELQFMLTTAPITMHANKAMKKQ